MGVGAKKGKNYVADVVRMRSAAATAAAVPTVEVVGTGAPAESDEEPF